MNRPDAAAPARASWIWTALLLASFAAIAALRLTDAIDQTTGVILMCCAMVLVVPLTRARLFHQKSTGTMTPAMRSYTRRFLFGACGYVLGLGIAISIHARGELSDGATVAIAMLPVVPILWMLWAVGRYLVEETDEFLRHRATMASLCGLGLVLVTGTFWGFLETFDVTPHVDAWWTFPVWAIGMGFAQCWMAWRDGRGAPE